MSDGPRLIDASEWRQQRFGWMEGVRRDANLNPMARLVAHVLALDFAHHVTLRCDPSLRDIAGIVGASTDTVQRAISALVEAGWLARECGVGRGRNSGYGFLTRARVVSIKGGKYAPPKGGSDAPFSGHPKGGRFAQKRGQICAPPINKDKPYKNHGARTGAPGGEKSSTPSLDEQALFWAESIAAGRGSPSRVEILEHIVNSGLMTVAELRAAGVDC